jgi:hypothetical protein
MMVEDESGGRRMNDLRTVVWLNMIDSVWAPLWFGNYGDVQLMEVVQQVF